MENEHYKRNDSILYLLVVLSICLSVVSIVMQFNLRSKASQAALKPIIQNQGIVTTPPVSTNDLGLEIEGDYDCSQASDSCRTACVLTNEAATDAAQAAAQYGENSVYAKQLKEIAEKQSDFYEACESSQ